MRFYYLFKRKRILTLIIGALFFLGNAELLKAQLGFNAQGCFIKIKPGTILHIEGNVSIENNGRFNNSGELEIKGDWINNSSDSVFIDPSLGSVKLSGANQSIGGTKSTAFNDISLTGTGIKSISNDSKPVINGNLIIGESGISAVTLVIQSTHQNPILIKGDFTVNIGSTYQNEGGGFNVQGNTNIIGNFTGTKDLLFSGNNTQTISGASFSEIKSLKINKSTGHIILGTTVTIDSTLILEKGIIESDNGNVLIININGTVSGGSDSSFVSGQMKKVGNTAFTFPLGDKKLRTGGYHPISITAPTNSTDTFIAQYFASNQMVGDSIQSDSLENISTCEYYTLENANPSSEYNDTSIVIPSIGWNMNSCNSVIPDNLVIAGWDGRQWKSLGNGGVTIQDERGILSAGSGFYAPSLVLTFATVKKGDSGEDNRNWVDVQTFDNSGITMGKTRSYLDALGRNTQQQSLDISNGNILATVNIFDSYGRPVIQTLSAPLYQSGIFYKNKFISNSSNNNYSYTDFDQLSTINNSNGEINNPAVVNNDNKGTLGWYYSNNNSSESYVPASSYPYSRIEYYDDPLGRIKRMAGVGENHKMGSGHESESYYMSSAGELFYAYGYKSSYILGFDQTDLSYKISDNLNAYKTINVDADRKESISFTNGAGQLIATCMSGMGTSCVSQKVSQPMYYKGERGVTVHLPAEKKLTLKLPVSVTAQSRYIDPFEGSDNSSHPKQINYYITDLTNNKLLVEGSANDFTFNRSSREITFMNNYAIGSNVFRITYDYTPEYLDNHYNPNSTCTTCPKLNGYQYIPDLMVSYELDYSDWNLNYYDKAGNLVKTASSQAIDCSYDPLDQNTVTIETVTSEINYNNPLYSIATPYLANFSEALKIVVSNFTVLPDDTRNLTLIDTSRTITLETISNELNIGKDFFDRFTVDTTTSQNRIQRPPPSYGETNYSFEMQFDLIGHIPGAGGEDNLIQLCPSVYKMLDGMYLYVTLSAPPTALPSCTSVDLNLTNIIVHQSTWNGYDWVESAQNYVVGSNLNFDYLLANWRLGITSIFQKYPGPHNVNPNLVSTIEYNKLNMPYRTSSPDEGTVNLVYDTEGKPRFTQNDLQASTGKFSFMNYDRAGRLIESGEYDPNIIAEGNILTFEGYVYGGYSPAAPDQYNVQNSNIKDAPVWWFENGSTQQTYYYYDKAPSDFPGTLSGYNQNYKDGLLSKVSNSNSEKWYGYDDLGRTTWAVNGITGLGNKTVNYYYTSDGLLDKFDFQKEVSNERFVHQYSYDANKRISSAKTSLDNTTFTTNQTLKYYSHGALKRNELGGTLQGLDYVYTINGLLKSVNEPTLTNKDPGKDSYSGENASFSKDVFGYTLDYYSGDYVRQNTNIETYTPTTGSNTLLPELYNGLVKASRWQTTLPTGQSTAFSGMVQYAYKYDTKNQLTEGIFGTAGAGTINGSGTPVSTTFTEAVDAYRVNNITYDKIGNMLTLKRNSNLPASPQMDDFTYNYNASKPNRLTSLTDAVTGNTQTDDIKNQQSNNYEYNSIGQLSKDNLADYNYTYNINGNVTAIKKTNGLSIFTIEYNSQGLRQKKTDYDVAGYPTQYTWYVYDAGGALLSTYLTLPSLIAHTDAYGNITFTTELLGSIQADLQVYGAGRIGVYDKMTSRYVYELTDHLGNVRATVRNNAGAAEVLSYADYYPHGSTMPGRNFISATAYKFGYQGQEKDNETGFLNFELRQYDARIGRWFNPDPMGQYHSPYLAMGNDPISRIDPTGGNDEWNMEHGGSSNYHSGYSAAGAWDNGYSSAYDMQWHQWNEQSQFDKGGTQLENYSNAMQSWNAQIKQYWADVHAYNDAGTPRLASPDDPKPAVYPTQVRNYGGDGSGSFYDNLLYGLDKVNQINPVANLWDAVSGYTTGKDRLGNPMSTTDKTLAAVGAFPFLSFEKAVVQTESNLWKVGAYNELKGVEAGLEAHHVGQKALMIKFIPNYNYKIAPAILVPKLGHTAGAKVLSRSAIGLTNARQVLARDIFELRRVYPGIPNSSLQGIIQMNKTMYPGSFLKVGF